MSDEDKDKKEEETQNLQEDFESQMRKIVDKI